ncbi:hypothetical protein [Streptomyces olivochromogenes]|nr:hypothetical protein [Streptomyces olivochromogenes]
MSSTPHARPGPPSGPHLTSRRRPPVGDDIGDEPDSVLQFPR